MLTWGVSNVGSYITWKLYWFWLIEFVQEGDRKAERKHTDILKHIFKGLGKIAFYLLEQTFEHEKLRLTP